ncbi:MAG TPA: hypothetical protein ENO25_02725, partial [Desulfobacteraceae bacterium]|nr:hypothetical protein [Desulfobacteraceae bacterium]
MINRWGLRICVFFLMMGMIPLSAHALSRDRWTNPEPYGVFFNDYDPNFYTGFVPRVQDRKRITIHLGRGNQVRLRLVLPEDTIVNYLPDQVARHDLYQELIDKKTITLTSNMAWEAYHERVTQEGLHDLAKKRADLGPEEWRTLNLTSMDRLVPGRLFHIQKDFNKMCDDFARLLKTWPPPETLQAKLDLVNEFFPHRIFLDDFTAEQEAAFNSLVELARADKAAEFRTAAEAFFHAITHNIYPVKDGMLDYYELTSIYPAGTYDKTTTHDGKVMPMYTTTGIWTLIPRMHGKGFLGMVDYISSAGYYGLMPMLPYEYGGGIAYNAIHNTGISCWIGGHHLLPKEWSKITQGSRNGKPFNRVAITSRGPVSHGCTRLNSGHLTEFREMLPSTSEGMEGIVHYRSLSHCYDVFDLKGDGDNQVMGVQYYIAFRHTKSRVAEQIWVQNNREDFYAWLYGDDITFGPIGDVTFKEAYDYK